jgi:hypothetical protein
MSFSSLVLNASIDEIKVTQSASSLEYDLDELINNFLKLITNDFSWLVSHLISGIFQGPVREALNNALNTTLTQAQAEPCSNHAPHNSSYYMEWASSKVIYALDAIVNDLLGPEGVNTFIECFSDNGSVIIPIEVGEKLSKKISSITLSISGLNSFYKVSLLVPNEYRIYDLDSSLGFAQCDSTQCTPLSVQLVVATTESDLLTATSTSNTIAMVLENIYVFLSLYLKHDIAQVADLTVSQLSEGSCMASTFDEVKVQRSSASVQSGKLYVNGATLYNIGLSNASLSSLVAKLNLTASVNEAIDRQLDSAYDTCYNISTDDVIDESTTSDSSSSDWVIPLVMVLTGSSIVLLLFVFLFYRRRKQGHTKTCWESSQERWDRIDWNETLIFGASIPWWARYSVPLVLIGTFAMFISSNLGVGASVELHINIAGMKINPDPIFEFGLANTVRDMWNAKTYALAILIAVFSGGWPYLKLVLMLAAWCVPASLLPTRTRERMLVYLDALGKWSLVDSFVLVLMMVAFRCHIALASGDNVLVVDVFVVPKWGFYGFLLATMISLGMTHLIVAIHRSTEKTVELPEIEQCEALMSHWYQLQNGREMSLTFAGRAVVVVLLLAASAMVFVGAFIESFAFEFKGLTGLLLFDEAYQPYSLISLGVELPAASGTPNDFGVRWVQSTYIAFGVTIPLALVVGVLTLWLAPLGLRSQRRLFVLCEILNAWSGLEVLVVSVIAAVLQTHQLAMFIVGDSCDPINAFLEKFLDDELNGDDVCFDVVATLDDGCWTLFSASIIYVGVMWPIMRMCHTALRERLNDTPTEKLTSPLLSSSFPSRQISGEDESLGDRKSFSVMVLERFRLVSVRRTIKAQHEFSEQVID